MKLTPQEELRLEALEDLHSKDTCGVLLSTEELMELQDLLDKQYDQEKYSKMKTISLAIAVGYLHDCAAVIVSNGDRALTYPNVEDLNGKDDNEFLYLSWTGDDGDFNVKCVEGNNRQVGVTPEGDLLFVDDEGEDVVLELLSRTPIKISDKWIES